MAVHDHQLTGMTQIRNMQVVGEVHVTGRPGHQREAGRHEYRRHNRQAVQAVGQVDRVAGADDHEIGQQDVQQAQLRHHVLKERHNQLGGWRVFPTAYMANATISAITDCQKYFQRAISPLVSLRTTLR